MEAAGETIEFETPESLVGERIDRVVSMMAGCARSKASLLVKGGEVLLNGSTPKTASTRVALGDLIQISALNLEEEAPAPDLEVKFEVILEDPDFLVINKPAGLVVHPGAGNPEGTLVNGLLARYPEISKIPELVKDNLKTRPGIVHRLDKETSGLMLVARTPRAYEAFVQALAAREITREYRAICLGKLSQKTGSIEAPIGRSKKIPTQMAVIESGKEAITHYEVLDLFKDVSYLKCRLETGRTHQIRVHLSAVGHPVLGDATYGGGGYGNNNFKAQKFTCLALYASRLEFDLPFPPKEKQEEGQGEGEPEGSRKFMLEPPGEFMRLLKYLEVEKKSIEK